MRFNDRPISAIAVVGISACYTVFGLFVLAPEGLYSGDVGVKFVQARALAASEFRSLDIPYPGEFLDPSREFFPIRPPFVMTVGTETQAIFSPTVAAVQAGLAAVAGLRGMVLLSLFSGAVILFAVRSLAPVGLKTFAVSAVGLSSPLWLYAVLGWEHAPAIACSTASFALVMSSERRSTFLMAGALLGVGALMRDEVILLLPGLVLTVLWRARAAAPLVLTAASAVLVILGGMAVDVLWFGRPPAAHLRHAVELAGAELDVPVAGTMPTLERLSARERYDVVIEYWLLGYADDLWVAAFAVTLAAVLAIRWRWPTTAGAVPLLLWLAAVVVLALLDAWEVVTAPKWLAGLHRVSPYLVFALLPPAAPRAHRGLSAVALAVITTLAFVAMAFATNTTGGKSLGPRLLLPVLPLIAVAAIVRIAEYLRANSRIERAVGYAGVGLVVTGAIIHLAGAMPAYYLRNRDDASAVLAALRAPARVIVADDMYTAQLLFPLYYRKVIFLADTGELRARLGTRLAEAKVPEVLLMSRRSEPGMRLSPLKLRESDAVGRFIIQYWGRIGRDLN